MDTAVYQETAVDAGARIEDSTTDHCPACTVARELRAHRDAAHPEWSPKRGALSFAVVIAERACPDYRPTPETPTNPEAASVAEEASHG